MYVFKDCYMYTFKSPEFISDLSQDVRPTCTEE